MGDNFSVAQAATLPAIAVAEMLRDVTLPGVQPFSRREITRRFRAYTRLPVTEYTREYAVMRTPDLYYFAALRQDVKIC